MLDRSIPPSRLLRLMQGACHPVSDNVRFTISPAVNSDIPPHSLKLCREGPAEEAAAGLHDKKMSKKATKKKPTAASGQRELAL